MAAMMDATGEEAAVSIAAESGRERIVPAPPTRPYLPLPQQSL